MAAQQPQNDACAWQPPREIASGLLASTAAHLLLLVPTLVTLQIYDRVLASRRIETLAMLLAAAGLALVAWTLVEGARARWYAAHAADIHHRLTTALTPLILNAPADRAAIVGSQLRRDLSSLHAFLSGPGWPAVIDLPWGFVYLGVIAAFHPLLGLVALMGMLALIALAALTEWALRARVATVEQTQLQAQHHASEINGLTDLLRAHGQQAQVSRTVSTIQANAQEARLHLELPGHTLKTWSKLVRQILQLTMLAAGALLVIRGQATAGVMIAGSLLLGKALMPLDVLIGCWKQGLAARAALPRLRQALAAQVHIASQLPETALPPAQGALRANRLGVKPSPTEGFVLQQISFELPAGAMLAVLGPSGSGKSTLARVLAGALAPTHGEVALDGAALHQYHPRARGAATGYLPQDLSLHSGTVAHNIARLWQPAEPLTAAQSRAVVEASQRAGAHELITALPQGYDTLMGAGTGAQMLSGGQRQRIALARAIYAAPDAGTAASALSLVVLDEPNSQLDAEGEAALERCLYALRRQGTTVVVATHRPHLIALASHVLLLRHGKVEQFGPREQVRQWIASRNQLAMKKQAGAT